MLAEIRQESDVGTGGFAHYQAGLRPKSFIEEMPAAQSVRLIKIVIVAFSDWNRSRSMPNVRKQLLGRLVKTLRSLNASAFHIDGDQTSVVAKFIAFGMSPKSFMIVEDQHGARGRHFSKK